VRPALFVNSLSRARRTIARQAFRLTRSCDENEDRAGGNPLPLISAQPVQGLSAVLPGAVAGSHRVMTDNGFGAQGNSAKTLLRVYGVTPDFRTATGGTGTVSAAHYGSGATLGSFGAASRITLADPDRKLGFTIQADLTTTTTTWPTRWSTHRFEPGGCSPAPTSTSSRCARTRTATSGSATSSVRSW
jgi:hypothetical protein